MEMFYENLMIDRKKCGGNGFSMNEEKYKETIAKIMAAKKKVSKEPKEYRLIKRFDVLEVDGVQKLISPLKDVGDEIKFFVTDEELYSILQEIHISLGHGGRDRMMKEIKKKYRNITYKDVKTFLDLCEPCFLGVPKPKKIKKAAAKPMKEMTSRCQVDVIDYQSKPDKDYKFVMVYRDHRTKFVILKALKTKTAVEIADNLIDIFTFIGAPSVLQSNNGREFSTRIIKKLKVSWPELKIIIGKLGPNMGSLQQTNKGIENMITCWMKDNKTCRWSEGLRFIQLMRNRKLHSAIKMSPFEAMFGAPVKVGLSQTILPPKVLVKISNEEELEEALNSKHEGTKVESNNCHNDEPCVSQSQAIIANNAEQLTETLNYAPQIMYMY